MRALHRRLKKNWLAAEVLRPAVQFYPNAKGWRQCARSTSSLTSHANSLFARTTAACATLRQPEE